MMQFVKEFKTPIASSGVTFRLQNIPVRTLRLYKQVKTGCEHAVVLVATLIFRLQLLLQNNKNHQQQELHLVSSRMMKD